jgi:acetylornithine deacetylase/succinyl-diaminopimelate desuccinylase-like protein
VGRPGRGDAAVAGCLDGRGSAGHADESPIHGAAPSLVNPDNPFIHAAAAAMEQGFGLQDDNLHAPNEKFYLPNFFRGIEAVVRCLKMLGG